MADLNALAGTALWTAAMRARESARPDRLFHDPFAAVLAAAGSPELDVRPVAPGVVQLDPSVPVRTRFFDDRLRHIVDTGSVRQVVLVAAGMDARAFRLDWPCGTTVYELDVPELLAIKQGALAGREGEARCRRRCVAVDLTGNWITELLGAGFAPDRPTVWLVEGLLYYLARRECDVLLGALSSVSAPESWLLLDYVRASSLRSPSMRAWLDEMAVRSHAWHSGCDDPAALLATWAWQTEVVDHGAPGADYGRWAAASTVEGAPGTRGRYLVVAYRSRQVQ